MALKLMYITNDEKIAMMAEKSGVDWIFVDLEINGKEDRQGHLNTVISRHNIDDVKKIKQALVKAKLLVRVNPLFHGSKAEIDRVINDGADIVMLPFFKTKDEIETFISHVDGRTKACLLLETPAALENIDSILTVEGIDFIHIGLNDLHLGYNMKFMFELLANGTIETLCNKIRKSKIPYGFGGIAKLGQGTLPAEYIIAEHYRLGSTMAILSRSFCDIGNIDQLEEINNYFATGVQQIRSLEKRLTEETVDFFKHNQDNVIRRVAEIVSSI